MTLPPVHCIDCIHFHLRAEPNMARQGYGHCDLDRSGRFQSAIFDRTCPSFKAASPEESFKRRRWLTDQRAAFKKSILGENS